VEIQIYDGTLGEHMRVCVWEGGIGKKYSFEEREMEREIYDDRLHFEQTHNNRLRGSKSSARWLWRYYSRCGGTVGSACCLYYSHCAGMPRRCGQGVRVDVKVYVRGYAVRVRRMELGYVFQGAENVKGKQNKLRS
jgi:hypothetical protein